MNFAQTDKNIPYNIHSVKEGRKSELAVMVNSGFVLISHDSVS
jgi:hypothetical protein